MAFDIQAAKQAGYSDEEIKAYLQDKPETKTIAPVAPGQEADSTEPPPPEGTVEYPSSFAPGLATAGIGLASAAVPLGIGYGVGKYGGQALNVARNFMGAPRQIPVTGVPSPAAVNLGGGAPQQIQVPQSAGTRSPAMQSQMQNLRTAPIGAPPAATPAPQAQPSAMSRGIQYADRVRQIAMEKVMQNAGGLAKAGLGAGAMLYSPGLNQGEDEELRRRRMMPPTITR